MKLDKEVQDKIDKLPLIFRTAAEYLIQCLDMLINNECDETEIINAMNTVKDNSQGRYRKSDLMNYDEAGKELGFGTSNRVGLKRFLDRYNVKQVKFGEMKVGFSRAKVVNLLCKRKR